MQRRQHVAAHRPARCFFASMFCPQTHTFSASASVLHSPASPPPNSECYLLSSLLNGAASSEPPRLHPTRSMFSHLMRLLTAQTTGRLTRSNAFDKCSISMIAPWSTMCFEPFDLTHTTDLLTAILSLFWRFFLNAIRYDSPAPIILASSPNNPRLSTHKQKMKHLVHFPAPTPCLHKKTSQHTTDLKRVVKQNTHAFHHQISIVLVWLWSNPTRITRTSRCHIFGL